MAPILYLDRCTAPTLVVAGDSEVELKMEETRSIFDAVAAQDKRLHIFVGGHHEDFLGRYEDEFKATLGGFLDEVSARWNMAKN
jgi:esterase/lipase